jgi:hypothetical protein
MDEFQLKGLYYNCDDKYFMGHKCKENKIFMVISEDFVDEDIEVSPLEEHNIFMVISEDFVDEDIEVSPLEEHKIFMVISEDFVDEDIEFSPLEELSQAHDPTLP